MVTMSIDNITMTGSEVEHQFDTGAASVAIHAIGGDVTMKDASGATPVWTIRDGEKEKFDFKDIARMTVFFTGTSGVILEIRTFSGFLT